MTLHRKSLLHHSHAKVGVRPVLETEEITEGDSGQTLVSITEPEVMLAQDIPLRLPKLNAGAALGTTILPASAQTPLLPKGASLPEEGVPLGSHVVPLLPFQAQKLLKQRAQKW